VGVFHVVLVGLVTQRQVASIGGKWGCSDVVWVGWASEVNRRQLGSSGGSEVSGANWRHVVSNGGIWGRSEAAGVDWMQLGSIGASGVDWGQVGSVAGQWVQSEAGGVSRRQVGSFGGGGGSIRGHWG